MNNKMMLYMDRYGNVLFARTLRELQKKAGGGRIFKVYSTTKEGVNFHCGYGVGKRWFTAYVPYQGKI